VVVGIEVAVTVGWAATGAAGLAARLEPDTDAEVAAGGATSEPSFADGEATAVVPHAVASSATAAGAVSQRTTGSGPVAARAQRRGTVRSSASALVN
jgi:hypothetical protein